jgi:dipeptide transport system permease protein
MGLIRQALHSLLATLGVLLAATALIFVLLRVIPGDPVTMMLGDRSNDQALADKLRRELGFDRSIPAQFLDFASRAIRGDLGRSHRTGRGVGQDLFQALPATLELALVAGFLSVLMGLVLGAIGPASGRPWIDRSATLVAAASLAIPTFWLGLLLGWSISVRLGWLELGSRSSGEFFAYESKSGFLLVDALLSGRWDLARNALGHLILPALTLAVGNAALLARVTRASLGQALSAPHIRAAKARGIGRWGLLRHASANALLPISAAAGLQAASLLSGAMVTEEIFDWPGLGTYLIQSIRFRDYPCIQAGLVTVVGLTIMANGAAAGVAGFLDPRIRRPLT